MSSLSDREREIRQKLKDDLPHYASRCLHIRAKDGKIVSLELNRAQQYIHDRLEQQRSELGRVRALILKGRQQGCSTYVAARYYHRASHTKGVRVFILTHEDAATQNLFEMVERYHENCPALVKPITGAANAKELNFDRLDSGYKVGTAGTKGVGRSSTIQLFHGSEVGFWPHAETHAAGVLQAVPDEPGTEAILESTANGLGNFFHQKWREAEMGVGDFIAIFVPWFWQEEYRRAPSADFKMSEEEREYADLYSLRADQIAWRRNKLNELGDDALFRQEYPATAAEAFQMSGTDGYIAPALLARARKADLMAIGPLVIGADPARFGNDRFSLAWRQGRKVTRKESKRGLDIVQGANWIKQVIDTDKPARVFIDVGGIGAGVYDTLNHWGAPYHTICIPIDFAGSPQERDIRLPSGEMRPGPYNRRAEMWMRSKNWLGEAGGADVPDDDSLQADACTPSYHYNSNSYLLIESKEHIRARGAPSPDEWDAVVLTFAEPVGESKSTTMPLPPPPLVPRGAGNWMGM